MRILKVKLYWKIEIKNYETLWKNMGHLACLYVFVGGNLSCAQSEALSCTRHCRVKIYKLVPPFFVKSCRKISRLCLHHPGRASNLLLWIHCTNVVGNRHDEQIQVML